MDPLNNPYTSLAYTPLVKVGRDRLLADKLKEIKENTTLLPFYSKPKCKKCYGRGFVVMNVAGRLGEWINEKRLCECVLKKVKEEISVLEGNSSG